MLNQGDRVVSPEERLLVHCARRPLHPAELALLQKLLEGFIDWKLLLQQAQRHALIPLLCDTLQRAGLIDAVPEPWRTALVGGARATAGRNLSLTVELTRILAALSAGQIAALPFKGPAVSIAAYGDISLRPFGDLDVLVSETHLTAARAALAKLGYRAILSMTAEEERAYLKSECAIQFQHAARGYVVELHWRLTERQAAVELPVEAFRSRSVCVHLAGYPAQTLCTEDLVLYLSVHGAKHQWERLEWISCLAALVRNQPSLDWPVVFQQACACRAVRMLRLGLCLAQRYGNAPLPVELARELDRDSTTQALAAWIGDRLFVSPGEEAHYQQRAARYLFMVRAREHWQDRLRILALSTFKSPHPEAPEWELPPRFAFLHRFFRPVRLLSEFGAVAWRHYLR